MKENQRIHDPCSFAMLLFEERNSSNLVQSRGTLLLSNTRMKQHTTNNYIRYIFFCSFWKAICCKESISRRKELFAYIITYI